MISLSGNIIYLRLLQNFDSMEVNPVPAYTIELHACSIRQITVELDHCKVTRKLKISVRSSPRIVFIRGMALHHSIHVDQRGMFFLIKKHNGCGHIVEPRIRDYLLESSVPYVMYEHGCNNYQ